MLIKIINNIFMDIFYYIKNKYNIFGRKNLKIMEINKDNKYCKKCNNCNNIIIETMYCYKDKYYCSELCRNKYIN
jgi:hypothetical protein